MAVNQTAALKVGLCLLGLCLFGYIVGPPLYWHFMEGLVAVSHTSNTCPSCLCDCSSQPLLTIPEDCAKHDPVVNEDTENHFAELLTEELKLREAEALENQQRADMALLEAKKLASQYQKEADKCNSGMETCEEAREKAEEALSAQMKLTAMWEIRARRKGGEKRSPNLMRRHKVTSSLSKPSTMDRKKISRKRISFLLFFSTVQCSATCSVSSGPRSGIL